MGLKLLSLLMLMMTVAAYAASPSVTNVTASQDKSSKVVNITYNLADADTASLSVWMAVSSDGGSTYSITPTTTSGDIGANVPRGTGKRITWNAGTDLGSSAYGTAYKVAIYASDNSYTAGQMVFIPAGSFLMGNSGVGLDLYWDQSNNLYDEKPQHWVTLAGYWIGKYEVTRGEYRQFMNAGGYLNSAYWSTEGWNWKVSNNRTQPDYWLPAQQDWGTGTFTQTDSHPVVGVIYYEAEAYCNWAGGHLPTEAQWEKAARWNPTTSRPNVYPWGDTWELEKCNNGGDSLYPSWQTTSVGSYLSGASPYGCQDMAGNVYEWCKDWYLSNYYSTSPTNNPQGPSFTGSRVLRGGGWSDNDRNCRCACRSWGYLNYTFSYYYFVGFRLAR